MHTPELMALLLCIGKSTPYSSIEISGRLHCARGHDQGRGPTGGLQAAAEVQGRQGKTRAVARWPGRQMGPLELQKEKVLMIVTENRFVDEELIISILILKKVVIIHRQYNVIVCSFFFLISLKCSTIKWLLFSSNVVCTSKSNTRQIKCNVIILARYVLYSLRKIRNIFLYYGAKINLLLVSSLVNFDRG